MPAHHIPPLASARPSVRRETEANVTRFARFRFISRESAVSGTALGVLYRFEMEDELGTRQVTAFVPEALPPEGKGGRRP